MRTACVRPEFRSSLILHSGICRKPFFLPITIHFPLDCKTIAAAGLLTCPPRRRLPGPGGPVAQECRNEKALAGGTHSSGNCCRFTRHSLLIPLHGETIARQRYAFIGRKQAIRRNISAKRAPPLCAADRSDHDASLFRQTAARLWHALCTYFSQLRHSNRSEVSSFI